MGVSGIRDQIKFGRIYGSGKLDYLYIKEEKDYYDVYGFENTGSGGTRRKGTLNVGHFARATSRVIRTLS
jgi:hypothetical protein